MKAFLATSPLIGTLLLCNVFAGLLMGTVYLLPLPGPDQSQSSAETTENQNNRQGSREIDLQTALARPLFHENRRPPQQEVAAPVVEAAPVKLKPPYQLVGILGSTEANRTAYLQHTQSQETVAAKINEPAGDWRIVQIGTNFVTLELNGEREVIQLSGGN